MSSVRIKTGDLEPIGVLVVDRSVPPAPMVGLTNIMLRIRRASDDKFLDWSDNTFKDGASVAQLTLQLTEVNSTYAAGWYHLDSPAKGHDGGFDTSSIVNPVDDDAYVFTAIQDGPPQTAGNMPQTGEVKVGQWVDEITTEQGVTVLQSFSYEPTGQVLTGLVWVEQNGQVLTTPTGATMDWRAKDGSLLFSEVLTGPDAQGFFYFEKINPGLVSNTPYYAKAFVAVPSLGTVEGGKGAFTVG